MKYKAIAFLLCLALLAGIATVSACSTRTPGYWKNHTWSITSPFTYTDTGPYPGTFQWTLPSWFSEATLQTPVRGDAKINLEQKVIAAILSIKADNRLGWNDIGHYAGGPFNGATLPVLITMAFNLINNPANSGPWTPGSSADQSGVRAQGLALASAIDYWLNFYDEAPIV
jgi:hypothetical protein